MAENLHFSPEEIQSEQWKPVPVPGYENIYEVSTLGRLRRSVNDCQNKAKKGSILKPAYPGDGTYQQYALCLDRKYSRWLAHRLVLTAFIGPAPTKGHHAAHIDGNTINNRLENLVWKTAKENDLDKDRHGTRQNGIKHGCAKLSEEQVREIRKLRLNGKTLDHIANLFSIAPTSVWNITAGRGWRHLA